ncbi:hypothetical protein [Lachnotalea glycerini]|uniref:Uncharacterized protein n=1 Tax=Lachnotalea glycerini TaxID=1763509 RepID=A0A371JBP8_9FIRM|nr:hypothetical protein [Lachnotalea glycerini]RDY30175.1 hypothetical protein CG710_016190 [Lachnotalea glycerini]
MYMTESEIVRNYKEAKNKNLQIKILADLNACEKIEIRSILIQNNIKLPAAVKKKKKIDWNKEINRIMKMQESGKKLNEIAQVYQVTSVTISRVIKKQQSKRGSEGYCLL